MKPTEELKAEHRGITQMLQIFGAILEKRNPPQHAIKNDLQHVLEFLKVFVDQCHHGKEEEFLFPALEEAGLSKDEGPVGVLLQEHQKGRELVGEMEASLENLDPGSVKGKASFQDLAENYISLLTQHIDKENHALFPLAEQKLSREKQHRMSEQFDRLEKERIGEGRHEAFHQLMEDLAGIYCP